MFLYTNNHTWYNAEDRLKEKKMEIDLKVLKKINEVIKGEGLELECVNYIHAGEVLYSFKKTPIFIYGVYKDTGNIAKVEVISFSEEGQTYVDKQGKLVNSSEIVENIVYFYANLGDANKESTSIINGKIDNWNNQIKNNINMINEYVIIRDSVRHITLKDAF